MQSTYTQPAAHSTKGFAQALLATLVALVIIAAVAISLALGSGALVTPTHRVSSQTTPMVDRAPAAAPVPVSIPNFGNGLRKE
jgi:hypothetical protein